MPLSTKYHPTKAYTEAVHLPLFSLLSAVWTLVILYPKGWQFDFIQCWMLKPCIKLATVPEAIIVQLFRIHLLVTLHGHFKFYRICFTALHHMIVNFLRRSVPKGKWYVPSRGTQLNCQTLYPLPCPIITTHSFKDLVAKQRPTRSLTFLSCVTCMIIVYIMLHNY